MLARLYIEGFDKYVPLSKVSFFYLAQMNDSSPIAQPFSKAQLELLQLFSFDIPEEQYDVLKKILLRFKAEVLMDKADRIWDEQGWTDEDIRRMLQTKMRTPYRRSAGK